jgi:lambda repressor-like predicted transcriptional regulator
MEELGLVGERAGLSSCDIAILRERGWTVTKLATLQGCHDDVIELVVKQCQEQNENFMADEVMMHDMVGFADLVARGIRCYEATKRSVAPQTGW